MCGQTGPHAFYYDYKTPSAIAIRKLKQQQRVLLLIIPGSTWHAWGYTARLSRCVEVGGMEVLERERKRGASDSAFIGIEGGDPRVLHFHSLSIILKHKCGN